MASACRVWGQTQIAASRRRVGLPSGDGYLSEQIPAGAIAAQPGRGALIAQRGRDAWLVLHAYGERRGLLDIGPLALTTAELDALFDEPNDSFLARIIVPFDGFLSAPPVAEATSLADVFFPRLDGWYQALHKGPFAQPQLNVAATRT